MMNIDNITEPGIYLVPKVDVESILPTADGSIKQRDVDKYRLLEHTDSNGKVTNWQKELPNGEWTKVDPIRAV